jgi:hypothetical protein
MPANTRLKDSLSRNFGLAGIAVSYGALPSLRRSEQPSGLEVKFSCLPTLPGEIGKSARATGEYEGQVLVTPSLDGVVLRYGFFCGPGTWYRPDGAVADQVLNGEAAIIAEGNAVWSFVHIDDAIAATVAGLTAEPDVCTIVDYDPLPVAEWLPAFAQLVDAPEVPTLSLEKP